LAITSLVNVFETKDGAFQKISPHELIDYSVWPLEGVKFS